MVLAQAPPPTGANVADTSLETVVVTGSAVPKQVPVGSIVIALNGTPAAHRLDERHFAEDSHRSLMREIRRHADADDAVDA